MNETCMYGLSGGLHLVSTDTRPIGAVDGGCRGLSVEDDGSVYYSGVPLAATTPSSNDATNFRAGHFVAKVSWPQLTAGLRIVS
jgi:hypothetical protein